MTESAAVITGRDLPRRPPTGSRVGPARWTVRLALPVALGLWLLSLRRVRLDRMRDLGLLQALPVLFWVALGLLTIGFALVLGERGSIWPDTARAVTTRSVSGRGWPLAYLLGLIAMLHATPSLLYPELRYSWAWKHVAVVDAMLSSNGSVPHAGDLGIYNQWPGFFQLNALLLRATGQHSALGIAVWTPPVANALLIGPLLLLYRSVTSDRRLIWGALWIFYSASWVGQDYFSPQAFAFLLYVTVLAVVLRQLCETAARSAPAPGARAWRAPPGAPRVAGGGWRPSRLALVLVIEAAIVSAHQLTPLMLISALLLLALPRANRRVVLPVLIGAVVLTALWDATVARPFVSANLGNFVSALSSPDSNALSGLAGLSSAAPGQVVVAWGDRAMSAALFLLAAIGFVRRPWLRRTGLPLLVIAPLPLLAANAYGGEMIFRTYLFSLPATAFLSAALLLQPAARPRLRAAVALTVSGALLGGLLLGYYGKETMNWFTPREAAATRYVTESTPVGSRIVSLTANVPGGEQHYSQHDRVVLDTGPPAERQLLLRDPGEALLEACRGAPEPVYVLLTRGQAAETYLTGVLPADTVAKLTAAADASVRFTVVHRDADAVIYRYLPPPTGGHG